MEQLNKNNKQSVEVTQKTTHHHRRSSSNKKSEWKRIYRTIFLIAGFTFIVFSITYENLIFALLGSILIFLSLIFTDVYKRLIRTSAELFASLSDNMNEGKRTSHRKHRRRH